VAIEVIRIGLSRRRDASRIAVADVRAGVAQLVGELDDQDAVLGREADQHDDADLAVEVQRLAHRPQADHSARRPPAARW
jgi:MoxR-like ATPase